MNGNETLAAFLQHGSVSDTELLNTAGRKGSELYINKPEKNNRNNLEDTEGVNSF
jgi:hypothetical protein